MSNKVRVLFVCMGNICRSPMAEAVFQHKVSQAGLADKIQVDSAGTGSWHIGEAAHRGTLDVLKRYNIPYNGRARQLARRDAEAFDYIVVMDEENLEDSRRMIGPTPNLKLFMSYANAAGTTDVREVPDPYYNGKFDEVYALVDKGADALLAHIRKVEGL